MAFIHFTNFTFHLQITAVCSHKEYLSNTAKTSKEKLALVNPQKNDSECISVRVILALCFANKFLRFVAPRN